MAVCERETSVMLHMLGVRDTTYGERIDSPTDIRDIMQPTQGCDSWRIVDAKYEFRSINGYRKRLYRQFGHRYDFNGMTSLTQFMDHIMQY